MLREIAGAMLFNAGSPYLIGMEKRQVLIIQMQPLLGEGLRRIFQNQEDVELVCLPFDALQNNDASLKDSSPDVVLLAGEKEDDSSALLISKLLKHFENTPIVWVELETNILHLYTSHSLTANSAELIKAVRENDTRKLEIYPSEKNKHSRP